MAKALTGTAGVSSVLSTKTVLYRLGLARLVTGYIILAGSVLALLGTSWDIQWHSFVGRDRTLIPPHVMSLTGITLCGLAALLAVILETTWAKRAPLLAGYTTPFADLFRSSLGAYVTGFAALNAAVAFPLDAYWHALYGIDVTIWAPFHVMILVAAAAMPLGGAYTLMSGTRLLAKEKKQGSTRLGYIGTALALGCTMGIFTILLPNSLGNARYVSIDGVMILNTFPILAALIVGWTFASARYALPWRWAASAVVGAYLLFGVLFELAVPPLMKWLVVTEQLQFRKGVEGFRDLSLVALNFWFLMPIVAAPLFDLVFRYAQKHNWSARKLMLRLALATLPACYPLVVLAANRSNMVKMLGITGLPLSLLLGYVAACIAVWLGRRTAETLRTSETVENVDQEGWA